MAREVRAEIDLNMWRVEGTSLVDTEIAEFFDDECYVVTNATEEDGKILRDVHFWLGNTTTKEKSITAAFKALSLAEAFSFETRQHREVSGQESKHFVSHFNPSGIRIYSGSATNSFSSAGEKYTPRLLRVKYNPTGNMFTRCIEVPLSVSSLDAANNYILDAGRSAFHFVGQYCPGWSRECAVVAFEGLKERGMDTTALVIEERPKPQDDLFYDLIGGKGPIAESRERERRTSAPKKLFQVKISDSVVFEELASGNDVKKELFIDSAENLLILEYGFALYVWLGSGVSEGDKKKALLVAQDYLNANERPVRPVSVLPPGLETRQFDNCFRIYEML